MVERTVIVVADNNCAKYARAIVHVISKVDGFESVYWEINHYRDNEMTLSKDSYVIFIGNNKISSAYNNLIKEKYNKFGIVYGYDSNKAMIYVDKSLILLPKGFEEEYNKIIKSNYNKEKSFSNASSTAAAAGATGAVAIGGVVTAGFIGVVGMIQFINPVLFIAKSLIDNKKKQYELGIASFSLNCLDDFINGR